MSKGLKYEKEMTTAAKDPLFTEDLENCMQDFETLDRETSGETTNERLSIEKWERY